MLKPTHHTTPFQKTAYYSTLGTPDKKVKYLWIICHGYGQLAKHIIHKFSTIASDEHFFVAPEGLSRFYWNEAKGQIGASWMTSEDRLNEIEDYSNWLQQIHNQFKPLCHKEVKIIGFGFSQGVATIWRWMMAHKPKLNSVVMWAGMTPEDLDYKPHLAYLSHINIQLIIGDADQFLDEKYMQAQLTLEQEQGLNIRHHSFEGKHEIDRKVLSLLKDEFLETVIV